MFRAVKCAWRAVDGLKTLGASVILFLLGVADWYDVVPIGALLTRIFGDQVGSALLIILPVVFGTLRFVTKGRVKFLQHDAGVNEDATDGEPF